MIVLHLAILLEFHLHTSDIVRTDTLAGFLLLLNDLDLFLLFEFRSFHMDVLVATDSTSKVMLLITLAAVV